MGQVPPNPEIIKITPKTAKLQPNSPPIGSPQTMRLVPAIILKSRSKLLTLPAICLPHKINFGIITKSLGNLLIVFLLKLLPLLEK